jgi:predicted MFS family arabinose efflux permease
LAYQWRQGPWALALALFAVAMGGALHTYRPIFGRALTTFCLVFAPNAAVLLLLVFVRASIDSAFTPARQVAIQTLAKDDELEAINGVMLVVNQFSKIIGPAVGGVLLIFVTAQWVFVLNAGLSLIAAIIVMGIALPKQQSASAANANLFVEAWDGRLAH